MATLNELIQQYCPNGVEYKELSVLEDEKKIQLGRGNVISKETIRKTPGNYPVYSSSTIGNGEIGRYGEYMFDDERINWSIDGGGKFFYRAPHKYSITNVSGWLKVLDSENISTKYIYYALHSEWLHKKYDYSHKAHPSVIRIEYKIPLPPIEVQNKIVEILNGFQQVADGLKAEKEFRQKQFEEYREKCLNFEPKEIAEMLKEQCPNGVEEKSIKKIFNTKNGYTPSTKNNEFWSEEGIPFIKIENILNSKIVSNSNLFVTKNALKHSKAFNANSIIMSTSATVGKYALISVPFLCNQRFSCLTLKPEFENTISIKYLLEYCYLLSKFCVENCCGSTFASVNMNKFYDFNFKLPPLSIQNKIVEYLEAFENLIEGLEKEYQLRLQQLNYYTEKLLQFKELKNTAK